MAIYEHEQSENVPELRRLLEESDSSAVRRRAAIALGEIGEHTEAVAESLAEAARKDPTAAVRTAAVGALDALGEPALRRLVTDEPDDGTPPVAAYVASLDDDSAAHRLAAVGALGAVGATGAADDLLNRLGDPNERVQRRVVRTLGRLGVERAIEPLTSLAAGASAELKVEIARSLGDLGSASAPEALLTLSRDESAAVRRRAVEALGAYGEHRSVERLVACLDDPVEAVRRAAVFAIVEALSNAPPEHSHDLRSTAVAALEGDHDVDVTETLVELVDESAASHQRRNAVWLLGRVSTGRQLALETLIEALGDERETVRQFAATSLMELDHGRVEEALLDAVGGSHGEQRELVLFVLGAIGSERSRERLTSLLDETETVDGQERILSALSKLGGV